MTGPLSEATQWYPKPIIKTTQDLELLGKPGAQSERVAALSHQVAMLWINLIITYLGLISGLVLGLQ